MVPTHELAVQARGFIQEMIRFMPDIAVACAIRGVPRPNRAVQEQIVVGK